jgi:hypothetical protein
VLLDGVVPFEMVKLWESESEVRKSLMSWNWVEESLSVDGGHGSWPFPDTSIATCRLSTYWVS